MTSLTDILFDPETGDNARTIEAIRDAKSTPIGDLRRENARLRRRLEQVEQNDTEMKAVIKSLHDTNALLIDKLNDLAIADEKRGREIERLTGTLLELKKSGSTGQVVFFHMDGKSGTITDYSGIMERVVTDTTDKVLFDSAKSSSPFGKFNLHQTWYKASSSRMPGVIKTIKP